MEVTGSFPIQRIREDSGHFHPKAHSLLTGVLRLVPSVRNSVFIVDHGIFESRAKLRLGSCEDRSDDRVNDSSFLVCPISSVTNRHSRNQQCQYQQKKSQRLEAENCADWDPENGVHSSGLLVKLFMCFIRLLHRLR